MKNNELSSECRFKYDSELHAVFDMNSSEPVVVLSGKACDVLRYLMLADGRVVSCEEFLQQLWGNTIVTHGSIKDYIAHIRSALGDTIDKSIYIQTVRGRGYRYLGGIASREASVPDTDLNPTLAIIPPQFNGDNHQQNAILSEIIAANIIEPISRSPVINVISRLSTRKFANNFSDTKTIGECLGADYLLSGVYCCQQHILTLSVELCSVKSAQVIYSESLSAHIENWINSQCESIKRLAKLIIDKLVSYEISMATTDSLGTLPLNTLMINAVSCMHSSPTAVFNRAEPMFKQILNKSPNNCTVLALLAQWHLMRMNRTRGLSQNEVTHSRDSAFRWAGNALSRNSTHSLANTIMGSLEARLNNNTDKAIEHHSIASHSNPNNELNHCFNASAYTYKDDAASKRLAATLAKRATRLSPLDPQLYLYKTVAAAANHHADNLYEARQAALDSHQMNPNHTSNLRTLISILVESDMPEEAVKYKDELLALDPEFTISTYKKFGPGMQSSFAQRIAHNLQISGVPA